MPGRVHRHRVRDPKTGEMKSYLFYHRKDGAWEIHGVRHARYTVQGDRKRRAKTKQSKKGRGKRKRRTGYPHTGDRRGKRV